MRKILSREPLVFQESEALKEMTDYVGHPVKKEIKETLVNIALSPVNFFYKLLLLILGHDGEKGDQGQNGDRGPTGPQGIAGLEGPEGPKVKFTSKYYSCKKKQSILLQGFEGPRGEAGAIGLPGEKGKQGKLEEKLELS